MKHALTNTLAAALALPIVLAGCSSSAGSAKTNNAGAAGGGSSSDYTATATAAVEAAYRGLYTEPAQSSAPAQKGKSIWVVSCAQALPGCAEPTAGVQEAANALGWQVTVVDGKANPAGYSAAIHQAIAAKADGIIGVAIDCPYAKSALQDAKNAKIPTVGVYAYDCNDPKAGGGSALYTATVNTNGTPAEFGAKWGKLKADYAIMATKGSAKIIQLTHPDFLITQYQYAGYTQELAKCGSCKVVDKVDITAQDLGSPATTAQKAATALQQHPEANVLEVPDDTTVAEIAQAVKAAHRPGLVVVAGEGYPSTFDFISNKVVTAAVAIPANWLGWSGADAMNRVLAGQTSIPNQGVSFQIIDRDHGLPAAGKGWMPSIDYKAAFTKSWGA
jgi:ribose transport system substrate-binding protein